jgi:predicted metalloprotease with PDZ domain
VQSLEESSFDAWIKFNRATPDAHNSTVSFYSKGALVSLLLDLELRARTNHAVSLDDVMGEMYRRFPLSGTGYTTPDLQDVLEEMSASSFDEFFACYVRGTAELPLEDALRTVGLELFLEPARRNGEGDDEQEGEGEDAGETAGDADDDNESEAATPVSPEVIAWLGLTLTDANGRTEVKSVRNDGPAWRAGVLPGDEVVALDHLRLRAGELQDRLRVYEPGQAVTLHVLRRDVLRAIDIRLGEKLDAKWSVRRLDDPSPGQREAFERWLGQPWAPDAAEEGPR